MTWQESAKSFTDPVSSGAQASANLGQFDLHEPSSGAPVPKPQPLLGRPLQGVGREVAPSTLKSESREVAR